MQVMELLDIPWEEITMDFITKLPKSKDLTTRVLYNSIMVVINRLTKYLHFIAFKETFNAEQLKQLFIDRTIWYQNAPQSIISDRDKLFILAYWIMLMHGINIKLKSSTVYHPQTNGQTEQSNQTLKQYLQHFVTTQQNNSVELLPLAQLIISNRNWATTGESPFRANHSMDPNVEQISEKNLQTTMKLQQISSKIKTWWSKSQ